MGIVDKFKGFFKNSPSGISKDENEKNTLETAAAVIMVNAASADKDFSRAQRDYIASALEKDFSLTDQEVRSLIDKAAALVSDDTNKWKYVNRINSRYSDSEKEQLIEKVWDIIYSDDRLHKYEDRLVHSLARMLHIRHKKLIELKIKANRGKES